MHTVQIHNIYNPQLFEKLFLNLSDPHMGGDFNQVPDLILDRSSQKTSSLTQSATLLNVEMLRMGPIDI